MNEKEDSAWVFDSLVGFLQGPIWSAPLVTFIEEKSLIFESGSHDIPEYYQAYQEYKNLVDLLLGCFMEDIGISPEQFEHACTMNKHTKIPVKFHHSLFEQIWAANEYEIFKNMMIQKNLELQLQALSMIEQKYGLTPASFASDNASVPDEEQLVMEELLNNVAEEESSKTEEEQQQEIPKMNSDEILREEQRLKVEYDNQHAKFESALRQPPETVPVLAKPLEALKSLNKSSTDLHFKSSLESIPEKETSPIEDEDTMIGDTISTEDKLSRQKYLKEQRDKLVALKKKARSHRLELNAGRPSSAKVAAEASISGKRDLNASSDSILQVRRALAARLKAEVVEK